MKKLGALLVFTLFASSAMAQDGDGAQAPIACDSEGDAQPHVAAVSVSSTEGGEEIIDIRISGRNANAFESMSFDIPGMRAAAYPMTKTSGSSGGGNANNGTSLWTVTIDLDQYEDAEGNVTVDLKPSCCYIPGAIVVRSKGR